MNKTWIKEHWLEILLCVGIVIQIERWQYLI